MTETASRHVLVLGAYGLIGAGVTRFLGARGHRVTGLGRDRASAHQVLPDLDWIIADLADMTTPEAWIGHLDGIDMVVNCAGALQAGPRDDLDAVHLAAIAALAEAAAGRAGLIQISASGVAPDASTAFMRTKAAGDAAVRASGGSWWILRPGLVLAPEAYGGTALLRMLAAFPAIQPLALPDARMQTVALEDVAHAIALAVEDTLPPGTDCDLVEAESHSLAEIVAAHRVWLGFSPARTVWTMPGWVTSLTARMADALGWLGWRSPLRSTALQVTAEGVHGDPTAWARTGQPPMRPLSETLASMPSGAAARLSARMALLMPLAVAVLSLFWLASGLIGLIGIDPAARHLTAAGWDAGTARASVAFWALVDIALGLAILFRAWAVRACLGMVAVSAFYLAAASVVTPFMWLDPLGPLVKVVPGALLALMTATLLGKR